MSSDKAVRGTKCITCLGRGIRNSRRGNLCGMCKGSGVQLITVDETGKYYVEVHSECPSCNGDGIVQDPQHGMSLKCEACRGRGVITNAVCEVHQCQRRAMPDRNICEVHAFPAARPPGTTGRRAAVLATKKKMAAEEAKVSEDMTDATEEEITP
jgi:DnaJ-class molecular chaperone